MRGGDLICVDALFVVVVVVALVVEFGRVVVEGPVGGFARFVSDTECDLF